MTPIRSGSASSIDLDTLNCRAFDGGWAKASTLVAIIVLRYQLIQLEIRMKKFALASALVLTLVSSYAQTTRPEVKAEAASAN